MNASQHWDHAHLDEQSSAGSNPPGPLSCAPDGLRIALYEAMTAERKASVGHGEAGIETDL